MSQNGFTKVEIKNGKKNTYPYRKKLQALGCSWNGTWCLETDDEEKINALIKFARRKKFKCKIFEPGYTRSNDYRKKFFEYNDKQVYRCAYCGKKLKTRSDVSVDHIIPVAAVQNPKTRKKYKRVLAKKGITDINDVRNLTSSCQKCNIRKSSNTGSWILRARIGSHEWFWRIMFIFYALIAIFGVSILVYVFFFIFLPF